VQRRRIDEVRISLRRGIVTIPCSSREALLERFRNLDSLNDVRDAFQAVGDDAARPSDESAEGPTAYINIFWADQTDGGYDDFRKGSPTCGTRSTTTSTT
jgi:hypothetical protein